MPIQGCGVARNRRLWWSQIPNDTRGQIFCPSHS